MNASGTNACVCNVTEGFTGDDLGNCVCNTKAGFVPFGNTCRCDTNSGFVPAGEGKCECNADLGFISDGNDGCMCKDSYYQVKHSNGSMECYPIVPRCT